VAAAIGAARKIGLDRILGPNGNRRRDLVLAMIAARVLDPVAGQRPACRDRGGAPQGAVISPLLANIYLHYVYDLGSSAKTVGSSG
jgi:hypothetical protein